VFILIAHTLSHHSLLLHPLTLSYTLSLSHSLLSLSHSLTLSPSLSHSHSVTLTVSLSGLLELFNYTVNLVSSEIIIYVCMNCLVFLLFACIIYIFLIVIVTILCFLAHLEVTIQNGKLSQIGVYEGERE